MQLFFRLLKKIHLLVLALSLILLGFTGKATASASPVSTLLRFHDERPATVFSPLPYEGILLAEEDIEDELDEDIEAEVEEDIEQQIEQEVEQEVEQQIEQEVEQEVEQEIEQEVEQEVEQEIEREVEKDIERDSEDAAEEQAEQDLEAEAEDDLDNAIDQGLDREDADANSDEEIEEEQDDDTDQEPESDTAEDAPQPAGERSADRETNGQTSAEQSIEEVIGEINGEKIFSRDWLVLAEADALADLRSKGYDIVEERALAALGFSLARVTAPATYDPAADSGQLLATLSTPGLTLDFNHVYAIAEPALAANTGTETNQRQPIEPASVLTLPEARPVRALGMVDSSVATGHSLLQQAQIRQKVFLTADQQQDWAHGTAVASILVGQGEGYRGLLPKASLYSASVFFVHPGEGEITTAEYLLQALDWLVSEQVTIINMSLVGPPNRLLNKVIEQMCQQGTVIIAAVGNSGPNSPARFPAAYPCAIGVTAIDRRHRIYRRAVRGGHVDISAYGVDLLHAGDPLTARSSGTSFAAPFVSAYLAAYAPGNGKIDQSWLNSVFSASTDLGVPGRDEIYGHGLLPAEPVR